jgi:TonB family protein
MYFDLEDYKPDVPRVNAVISVREGILLSLLLHALAVIAYLVMPQFRTRVDAMLMPAPSQEEVRFVHMAPRTEVIATPKPQAEHSDIDRRAASQLVPPDPRNDTPFSRGNTPEKMVGAPNERPKGPDNPAPPSPPATATIPDNASRVTAAPAAQPQRPPTGGLGQSLRNLQQFLQDQNYDNPQGGQADQQNADIQFDSKGVDFGPWLKRFVAQVKRNWYVPQAAMFLKGRVVITFYIARNGTISDLKVVQPSPIEPFNLSAMNALRLSNPTLALPAEYPDERAFFTVTFHYNDR